MSKTEQKKLARIAVIDEIGLLSAELAAVKPKADRLKLLRETAASWPDEDKIPAEQAALYDGTAYSVEVSARESKRAITDMSAVLKALGRETFLTLCSITLKNLDSHLKPEVLATLVTKTAAGPRSVTPLKRAS